MATATPNPLADIERRRAQLEENVAKLRQALKQWQTWEFEYEMFKEEIQSAGDPSYSDMITIGQNLGGSLVNAKEVKDLVGKDQARCTANQVIDKISKRVDYVQQNISTITKQLDSAEKKLEGTSVLLAADVKNEEGLPLMDIQEELDEEGNVISSSVLEPGKAAPEIVETLRKAGIQKLEKMGKDSSKESRDEARSAVSENTTKSESSKAKETNSAAPVKSHSNSLQPAAPQKTVSFAEDTKADSDGDNRTALEKYGYNEELGDLADYNFPHGNKVIEVDDDDNEIASYPIIPQGESPEDAALRRQMLQYGLSEVGQVVAEIDLDGRGDDYSDEDMDEDYDEDYDSNMSEYEDEHGRSLRPEITEEYRKQMMELEKKLNARMLENIGPRPDTHPLAEYSDDVRTLKVQKDDTFDESISKEAPVDTETPKKGVRFAESLDISPDPQPATPVSEAQPKPAHPPTIADTIVERSGPTPMPPTMAPSKPAKVSRFKSARAQSGPGGISMLPTPPVPEPLPVPKGPTGQAIASTIVEHDIAASEPRIPDEFDPVVINREIQTEYHKMRNKMIQKQGGFTPSQEEQDYPLMEEIDGKTKKVSRFKAARLKADGL
jgi:unconventional prefoldin RPB5 interactor 1